MLFNSKPPGTPHREDGLTEAESAEQDRRDFVRQLTSMDAGDMAAAEQRDRDRRASAREEAARANQEVHQFLDRLTGRTHRND